MNHIETTLVFLRRENEILLAMKKQGHGVGFWNGVGGKLDSGETVEQALVRECQEEIGVTPTSYEPIAINAYYQLYHGAPTENICHAYTCTIWEGEPRESEEMAPQWFQLADLPLEHMWPDDTLWLRSALSGERLRCTFRHDDTNQIQTYEITKVKDFA